MNVNEAVFHVFKEAYQTPEGRLVDLVFASSAIDSGTGQPIFWNYLYKADSRGPLRPMEDYAHRLAERIGDELVDLLAMSSYDGFNTRFNFSPPYHARVYNGVVRNSAKLSGKEIGEFLAAYAGVTATLSNLRSRHTQKV